MFMLEKAMVGSRRYWGWLALLLLLITLGAGCYLRQLRDGLVITGLSRDVIWGLYIAQFTFFVGVAASAVMVVLPYYLHDVKAFQKITILGELLAVSAVTMCMLFVVVDMGQPARVLNVLRYPTLSSVMFWDLISLGGYLLLNGVISIVMLSSERTGVPAPHWIRPVILVSIPWAVSIHTVTAFLYSGLAGRTFWMTAILAPRFLASAFASGPALLILLCLLLRRLTSFDAGEDAIRKLGVITAYAMSLSVFFVLLELFTVFYSRIPEEMEHFRFLFVGLEGDRHLAPWMWISAVTGMVALVLLLVPKLRNNESVLAAAAVLVFVSLWIEKGLGLIVGGFVPSPLGSVTRYSPTAPEWVIVLGVWAIGALMITVFYKITVSVREVR
ncbi:MAG TPA: NrfD/PsrC family molybdoenzyme membrane anchor subunit [Terriglobales bacterium]|nr:NrfD/PsrC family molybdoenzyme membrane anchor subunit [Terriglobales bacterium]